MRRDIRAALRAPTTPLEREPLLDAIRGIALGGILLANLMSFFGSDMIDPAVRRAMPAGAAGERVLFGINWFVEGKFYSIFSMLLGTGFALQLARTQHRESFAAFFRRRLLVLVAIGLTHMCVLWSGDILTLYGVMGLLLPALFQLPPRTRAAIMVALFAVPLATHAIVLASEGRLNPRPPFAAAAAAVRDYFGIGERTTLEVFAHGPPGDYARWNIANAVARPGTYLQSGRPAKVLALFLLGSWLGVAVLPRIRTLHRPLMLTMVAGAAIGLPCSYLYATIKADTASTFLMSPLGLAQTAAYTFGTTPLALAYLAAAALAWQTAATRGLLEWFVPLGRMALSVYLTQTVIQLAIFSGAGLRLAGHLPLVWLPIVAAAILIAQRQACAWWLVGHAQGPVEQLWRRATYP